MSTEAVADFLDIGRRTFERVRAKGEFPPPDLIIGKMPRWKPETIEAWVGRGGGAS
jgi:predicted DNA-binding transcriptional regulator AlpA